MLPISEFKRLLNIICDEDNQIVCNHKPLQNDYVQQVENLYEIKIILEELSEYDCFDDVDFNFLEGLLKYKNGLVLTEYFNQMQVAISTVNGHMVTICAFINARTNKINENSFSFKIPSDINDSKKLKKEIDKIEKIIKCFIIEPCDVQYVRMEEGSSWITYLAVANILVMPLLIGASEIAKNISIVQKNYYETELIKELAQSDDKKSKKQLVEAAIEQRIYNMASELIKEFNLNEKKDMPNIIGGIKQMMTYQDRGGVVRPLDNAPTFITHNGASIEIDYTGVSKIILEAEKKEVGSNNNKQLENKNKDSE